MMMMMMMMMMMKMMMKMMMMIKVMLIRTMKQKNQILTNHGLLERSSIHACQSGQRQLLRRKRQDKK